MSLTKEALKAKFPHLSDSDIAEILELQAETDLASGKITFNKYYLGIKTNGSITDKIAFLREALDRVPPTESRIDLSSFSDKEVTTRSLLVAIGSVASSWALRGDHLDTFVQELENAPKQAERTEEVTALADLLD